MKIAEAEKIIEQKGGFMVHFEVLKGHKYGSDYFPDKYAGEELISTEEKAWDLAKKFAKATDSSYVNISVVDRNFKPVNNYIDKMLKKQ